MDVDTELVEALLDDAAVGHEDPAPKANPKKRGRPKGAAKTSGENGGGEPEDESSKKKRKGGDAKAVGAGGSSKAKMQCMCCGKIFERSSMANNRYCKDGKRSTDRLYHAAKGQNNTEWLSDQPLRER